MAQVPTSVVHLLNPETNPLVTCRVSNAGSPGDRTLRLRFTSSHALDQLPTFFPERLPLWQSRCQYAYGVLDCAY